MGRKRRLTDTLPVVKRAKQRDSFGKEAAGQRQPGSSKASAKDEQREKKDTGGITRMERWQRAQDLGLTPSEDIKEIIMKHSTDPQYIHNLWSSYAI
ncbi:DNA polymerase delta subunit 4 [Hyperolius riggenbachi]|uniref:DNA polymerase delta subunit 4 n=1 Tax=Hyperolius riggenbachi TaxID=752182 RepID=UPI0035A37FF0